MQLKHAQKYSLVLRNANRSRCNAKVEIDGKHQGTWRLNSGQMATIERPAHDKGCFTFYEKDSIEGRAIALDSIDASDLGLIKVTFIPETARHNSVLEVYKEPVYRSIGGSRGIGAAKGFSAGGTGLSGWSGQDFGVADEMELDYSKQTVIHLRLVAIDNDSPRPLTQFSSPVPPPIIK